MIKRWFPFVIVAALLLLAGGVIWAANISQSDDSTAGTQAEASATIAVTPDSTAEPTATEQPPPTDPPATATPQPPAATATPPPPAPTAPIGKLGPDPTCPLRTNNHLNIDLLRLQPGLTDAAITELDANTIRVELQGEEYEIIGWGDNITIGGSGGATGAFFDSLMSAVLAVVSDC